MPERFLHLIPFLAMTGPNGKLNKANLNTPRIIEGIIIAVIAGIISGAAAALLTSYIAVQRIEEQLISIDSYMRHEHDSIIRDIDRLDRTDAEFNDRLRDLRDLHTNIPRR